MRARPAARGAFLLFRLHDGFTVQPWLTFPKAPTIPDRQISRIRFETLARPWRSSSPTSAASEPASAPTMIAFSPAEGAEVMSGSSWGTSASRTDRLFGRAVDRLKGSPAPGLPSQRGNNTSNKNHQEADESE
jgi:hypothetical protein